MNIIIPCALEQIGGCITLNDDSKFGIRCNHFMWAEGWIEGAENNHAILVYGNHKGGLEIVLQVSLNKKEIICKKSVSVFVTYMFFCIFEKTSCFSLYKGRMDDNTMRDNEVRLAEPTMGEGDVTENVIIDVPLFEYA